MVQNHSKENLMSSRNLAAIFQPSILSHPSHDLDPIEYALSQSVVEFLIQYAYKLLPNHEATVLSPEATSPTTKSAMPTHISTNTANFAPTESDVTSTSTSPLGEEAQLTKDAFPHVPPPRHHSISSGPNNDDLVSGYQHNVTGSLPFDSDMESDIGSDLDELHFQQLKLNEGSPIKFNQKSSSPQFQMQLLYLHHRHCRYPLLSTKFNEFFFSFLFDLCLSFFDLCLYIYY